MVIETQKSTSEEIQFGKEIQFVRKLTMESFKNPKVKSEFESHL